MAPIRRYLRITKYSVLEVRIYLQKPSDISWLLSSRDPALPRIIQEVRPKVLPKLREENENAKRKTGKKKRGIKDVASGNDFDVAIFLKETSTRHSLLTKHKDFKEKPKIVSTGNRLTGWLNDSNNPIHVEDDDAPRILQEEDDDDDEVVQLHDLPEAGNDTKRKSSDNDRVPEALFVGSSDDEALATEPPPPRKRRKQNNGASIVNRAVVEDENDAEEEEKDDKKKMALDTTYDGFSIYGRILCLIVTRKNTKKHVGEGSHLQSATAVGGSQMMEQWVSTQVAQEQDILEDDEG